MPRTGARAGIDRLLGHKVLRRESAGVSTESALRGARASAALEGVDVPLADLRAGNVEDPLVQGALRVSAGLGSMVETWSRAPGQVLARLHVLAAADLVDAGELGRPPPHAGPRLSGLFSLATGTTSAPAVLIAALVHGELAAMAPFGTADGVVARAAGAAHRHHPRTRPEGRVGSRGRLRRARPGRLRRRAGRLRVGHGAGCRRLARALLPGDRARRSRGSGHLREPAPRLTSGRPRAARTLTGWTTSTSRAGPGQPDRAGNLAVRFAGVGIRRRVRRPRRARHRPAGPRAGHHALRHRRDLRRSAAANASSARRSATSAATSSWPARSSRSRPSRR